MKRLGRWIVGLAVVGLGAWLLWLGALRPEPLSVTVSRVERGVVEETVTNTQAGTVEARRRAKLSPEIGGRVVALPHGEGDRVKRRTVVLRLEDSVQRARLEVARRELEAARAESRRACLASEQAARELGRNRGLAERGIISSDLLDRLESAAATSDAACEATNRAVERAEAGVELTRAELDKMVIRAPFDAVVAEVSTEVGEYVTPAPPAVPVPPVLDLLDPGSIRIRLPMDEVDSARLERGLPARVTVDSHPGRQLRGTVVEVASYVLEVEKQNRTVEIEVELDDPSIAADLLPGTSADVEVILEVREETLRIPTQALIRGRRVLVVEEGVLADREVEVGLRNWDFTEILEGLEEGEPVVTSLAEEGIEAGAEVVIEGSPAE